MADEIDKGQASGEVKTQADNQLVRSADKLSVDDLGLDRRRVSEWLEVRDAGEEVVEGAIRRALEEGRAPTKSEILEAAKAIRAERANAKREKRTEVFNT